MSEKKDILFCESGGCTAKLGAKSLNKILSKIPKNFDSHLLVGFDSSDDAAVYKVSDEIAIVSTLDFFPPMVEDPYVFGQIAATNAMSDVWAMGGQVKSALNIVCFPETEDMNVLGKIIQGGAQKVQEAGAVLAGGHSIIDKGIKYGLSVTGIVNPKKFFKNNTPSDGDVLILTKPIGVGVVCAGRKVSMAEKDSYEEAIRSMITLNKYAIDSIENTDWISAVTDVTGFGLAGHLSEMLNTDLEDNDCEESQLIAEIYADKLPTIKGSYDLAKAYCITAAGQKNRNYVGDYIDFEINDFGIEELIFDPQTSGGLLMSVRADKADRIIDTLKPFYPKVSAIGFVKKTKDLKCSDNNKPKRIIVK